MADSQLLAILLVAMVAAIILFRLYTVLGRRTGNEREPRDRLGRIGGTTPSPAPQNVAALPDRTAASAEQAQASGDPASGLVQIKLADSHFETEHFLDGARHAYEMIVKAFAARDRATLRPLLSDEVFSAFDAVMREREAKDEAVSYSFVEFKNTRIVHAELKGTAAEITVEFTAQFISATTDASGMVIEGDPKAVRDVTDVWSFARDIHASDPNWTLVATAGAG
ncbi:MAG TPA: Tim44/TimA family putative adaptor protein [Rhizomicrobium sp.]|jgi:predicted lipid-binding transport protein (Tim44 family)